LWGHPVVVLSRRIESVKLSRRIPVKVIERASAFKSWKIIKRASRIEVVEWTISFKVI
jgi:hypothetical protein